jgi:hypothetical protein
MIGAIMVVASFLAGLVVGFALGACTADQDSEF